MRNTIKNDDINKVLNDPSIKKESSYYQFGWKYFGPFLLGFTKWLYSKLQDEKIKKVYFFSRDGYMMQKSYEIFAPDDIEIEYVYFSRKSIRQALLYKCDDYKESIQYLSIEKYIFLGKILEYYGYSKEEREEIARENKWNLLKEFQYTTLDKNVEIKNIYKRLEKEIKQKSRKQKEYLLKYLNQINFYGDCAIVDIGWHGSMQYYLEKFCSLNELNVNMHGYYVGIMPNVLLSGSVDGYIYNSQNPKLRKSLLCFFGVLEKLFQSTEGSTYGYTEREDRIIPVCNTYEYFDKVDCVRCIREWQKGAINFIKKIKNNNIDISNNIELAMPLIKFGKYPSLKDVELFSFFYNTDGIKEYYVSQKGLLEYKPKELLRALSNSVWKTGFMKSVFKIPFPYFYIYSWIRR